MLKILGCGLMVISLVGCTLVLQKGRRSDIEKIRELDKARKLLESRLTQEIEDKQVKLQMMKKGLVITFVADILFDSGKAKIKPQNFALLDKVARVLIENVPENNIGIEGHTDNRPIKYSGWKSNWELSTARALAVLHYLVDKKGISPQRVSAIGYGEYRPVASNVTRAGRQKNRRVEIVILPRLTKMRTSPPAPVAAESEPLKEPIENLK
jgi:chemotaxis protein MotB